MARAKKSRSKISELEGQADPRAPLDSAGLLAACQGVLARLEADLLERARSSPAVTRALEARYQAEKAAERTAESFAGWSQLLATQVAAAWILSCVFVRTLEDRGLLKQARLAGPGAEDSQRQFFQLAPSLTERDYLLTVFRELAHHPAARDLFDERHSPVWKLSPSAAAAQELLALFRTPNATAPALRFGQSSTRFLGDLYQDLSEDVRKRYALLQTPDFIESFILDRTLEPAIQRFGLDDTTLIDPTCGSGHFLLGAFDRLFDHRLRAEPGVDPRVAAVKALDCVYGADINPYAVAIARFRLTLSFLEKAGYRKLAEAPALPLHLVVADSLRINPQHAQAELWQQEGVSAQGWLGEAFTLEDEKAARDVLFRQYAAVVGNPPYITPRDRAQRTKYAEMYKTCFMNYALSVPFCERMFQLARARGYTGQITANSLIKREFGKKLIEDFLPCVNLELIVNSTDVDLPGHTTPTILLFGTNEKPASNCSLAILAKRGQADPPLNPAQGAVWRSIADHWNQEGFDNEYITVVRIPRDRLGGHPWSLGGGGANEIKAMLEERAPHRLSEIIEDIGFSIILGEDDVFTRPRARTRWEHLPRIPIVVGEEVRDWVVSSGEEILRPFDAKTFDVEPNSLLMRELWPWRTILRDRIVSGSTTMEQAGKLWFDVRRLSRDKHKVPLSIAFAFVATHNHFVFDRGGKVFNRTAPIIKLHEGATEREHLTLIAYLNSSVACFWMKQVLFQKTSTNFVGEGKDHPERIAYEFASTPLQALPVYTSGNLAVDLAMRLDRLACARAALQPAILLGQWNGPRARLRQVLSEAEKRSEGLLRQMVALQEELDWLFYVEVGLAKPELLASVAGCDFDQMAADRDARPAFDFDPNRVEPPRLASLWSARKELTSTDARLALLESPMYKRPWLGAQGAFHRDEWTNSELLELAAQDVSLNGLECTLKERTAPADLADVTAGFKAWVKQREYDELYVEDSYLRSEIGERMDSKSIPYLAAFRYSDSGMEKWNEWNIIWELQRAEDLLQPEDSRPIPVAPRFAIDDFRQSSYWPLRGKLDVPKELFISYPGCESDNDDEPVYGWAGWDHLQRAKALATLYLNRRDQEGWTADRLTPMLAGLLELIPWVKQWHNEPSGEFGGLRMGDYYEQFLDGECRRHGLMQDDLRAWRPAKKARGGGKAAAKGKAARAEPEAAEAGNGQNSEKETPKKRRTRKPRATESGLPAGEEAE